MKVIAPILLGICIFFLIGSCTSNNEEAYLVTVSGIIKKQEVTTHQYGTYYIENYALRSNRINLDNYLDKKVTVMGSKIDGYPIDGGPEYIEVETILMD